MSSNNCVRAVWFPPVAIATRRQFDLAAGALFCVRAAAII
jgi:hypothetical protein